MKDACVGASIGAGVSEGETTVSVRMTRVSVAGIASGVGEEQETIKRTINNERRLVLTTERNVEGMCAGVCLCMGEF
jgi:hypothetical protein